MNSTQRLYVTPEERARRMAAQNGHPHGGEGNCGGKEGHGSPELARKRAEEQAERRNGSGGKSAEASRTPQRPTVQQPEPRGKASSQAPSAKTVSVAGEISRKQLISAMRLSFALGEPACRRYGMTSPYGKNGVK